MLAQGGPGGAQQAQQGGWHAAAGDGGHLSQDPAEAPPQPGSPDYRERSAGGGLRAAGETKGVRWAAGQCA